MPHAYHVAPMPETVHHAKGRASCEEEAVDPSEEDAIEEPDVPGSADVYGWAVSVLIRDTVWFYSGTKIKGFRCLRMTNAFLIACCTMGIQFFLLEGVWRLLCKRQVHRIRVAYNKYEMFMYDANETWLTVNGYHRGTPGHRHDERFLEMDAAFAEKVCEIPLSHPWYLTCIILVWTFTVQSQARNLFETSYQLLVRTPSVSSLDVVLSQDEEDERVSHVEGLTVPLKLMIGFGIQLPRFVALLLLLWLGCRWLTATLGLADVLLNGVALEFILVLGDLLYNVLTSNRNKITTETLYIRPFREHNKASCWTFFDAQIWGVVSLLWAVLYVRVFQQVLPHYQWDLHDLCEKHLDDMIVGTSALMAAHGGHGGGHAKR